MVSTNQIVNKDTIDLFSFDEFVLFSIITFFYFERYILQVPLILSNLSNIHGSKRNEHL